MCVDIALSAEEGLNKIDANRPHCVLLDCVMPGLDGAQLAALIRQRYGDDIVLIAVTGTDVRDGGVKSTFELVDHYLLKPIDFKQLSAALPPLNSARTQA
jgi:DNA-binding response OmpR family regulator